MGLRYRARLRAAALGVAAISLVGMTACGEGGEDGGQIQEENGEQEEEGE